MRERTITLTEAELIKVFELWLSSVTPDQRKSHPSTMVPGIVSEYARNFILFVDQVQK